MRWWMRSRTGETGSVAYGRPRRVGGLDTRQA
jgi:hypothetical protein